MTSNLKYHPDPTTSGGEHTPDAGQMRGAGAKMVGGGLEAGSTDRGSNTSPMTGGGTGFAGGGAGTSQDGAIEGGDPDVGPGRAGAGGTSVTATGRPMSDDARGGIGAAAVSGGANPDVQDTGAMEPGGTTRSAVGASVGNVGGGTMGTGSAGHYDRPLDVVEGRVAGPPGALGGRSDADPDELDDQAEALRRARQQGTPGRAP